MSRNKGEFRFDWPVSVCRMEICMTDTAGHHANQDLTRARLGYWHLFNGEWLGECMDNSGFHLLCHRMTPFQVEKYSLFYLVGSIECRSHNDDTVLAFFLTT